MAPGYDRDMLGYGAAPPDAAWPGGAVAAVQIVVNYEEGGERCILHGDRESESFLSEIGGAEPWPGQRHWNMESIYEYGARSGFWRLMDLLQEFDVPATAFGVATALARSPSQVTAMQGAGWEIASHGLKWIDYRDVTEAEEWEHMQEAIRLHRSVTGERPLGWYTGRCSANTVRLAAREGGFEYVADSYADDLPYWIESEGRQQLIVPYTLDANDMQFATGQGFTGVEQFTTYLVDTLDQLVREGRCGQPKMMSVGLHCRLAGRPGRTNALRRFLEHARSMQGVWFARRLDIARHWCRHHPYNRSGPAPVRAASPDEFIGNFGEIFEHSPWVAEQAFHYEIGKAHDCMDGVHNLLCRAFRDAGEDRRLEVLAAHPELAVKPASGERLTESSEAEQAGAGLDSLTVGEAEQFRELNRDYRRKFGFPFIMAVAGFGKREILLKFAERMNNDRQSEFDEACRQVERIARIRLTKLFAERGWQ